SLTQMFETVTVVVPAAVVARPAAVLDKWKEHFVTVTSDSALTQKWSDEDTVRRAALQDMAAFVGRFVAGRVTVAELASQFDRRSKKEWKSFGLQGFAGAMFLNQIAKHVPDGQAATAAL